MEFLQREIAELKASLKKSNEKHEEEMRKMLAEYEKVDLECEEKDNDIQWLLEEREEFLQLIEKERANVEQMQGFVSQWEQVIKQQQQKIEFVNKNYEELQKNIELKIFQSTKLLKSELEELQNQKEVYLDTTPDSHCHLTNKHSLTCFLVLQRHSMRSEGFWNTLEEVRDGSNQKEKMEMLYSDEEISFTSVDQNPTANISQRQTDLEVILKWIDTKVFDPLQLQPEEKDPKIEPQTQNSLKKDVGCGGMIQKVLLDSSFLQTFSLYTDYNS